MNIENRRKALRDEVPFVCYIAAGINRREGALITYLNLFQLISAEPMFKYDLNVIDKGDRFIF